VRDERVRKSSGRPLTSEPPLSAKPSLYGGEDGREQEFRIVGEDEADPSHGTVSYVSPLARAVLNHGPGDTVEIAGRRAVILDVRMPKIYVEARPNDRPEGSPIEGFAVEDHSDHALSTFKTRKEAIDWARKNGHAPYVARVRHLNNKKLPDHWRAA
jgi:hypothetical protein